MFHGVNYELARHSLFMFARTILNFGKYVSAGSPLHLEFWSALLDKDLFSRAFQARMFRSALPGLNLTTFLAGISMTSPVWGFRPLLAFCSLT